MIRDLALHLAIAGNAHDTIRTENLVGTDAGETDRQVDRELAEWVAQYNPHHTFYFTHDQLAASNRRARAFEATL